MAADLITVFISYAHEDTSLARAIQHRLEGAGFKVWIDEGALRAGDSLIGSIATAIHAMEFVVALITDASVDSQWCQLEIRLAMTSGLNREGVKVLPVRVGNAPIPAELEDTYCAPLDSSNLDKGIGRLIEAVQSHHAERRKAEDAGEPLPTTGAMIATTSVVHPPTVVQEPPPSPEFKPIRIIGIAKEGVGQPRGDGTRGSALYRVPLRLSRQPSQEWGQFLVQCWNSPPQFTTMHRPGIASVQGNTIVLDGTEMDELEKYHAKTLRLCIQRANEQEATRLGAVRQTRELEEEARREHQRHIDEVADRLRFDDDDQA